MRRNGRTLKLLVSAAAVGLMLAACSESAAPTGQAAPVAKAAAAPAADPRVEAINTAQFTGPPSEAPPENVTTTADATGNVTTAAAEPAYDPMLIKAEVLLDRARFSPGVIDGKDGTNLHHAISAFQEARGLTVSGDLDEATWAALSADNRPVAATYTLTAADVQGPFSPDTGEDFVKMADLPMQGYTHATEGLAERFHMDEALLIALNPGVDFKTSGQSIVVAQGGAAPFAKGDVDHIEVSKTREQVVAFDKAGKVLAVYPATVGSRERPSPTGTHKVNGVANDPDYIYDPAKLTWGPRSKGKLTISAGPNNPVGLVWIDLDRPSYGIHGSPEPKTIGKTGSHGCVRLTNWDAVALAAGVAPGVTVKFV
jgi:lipoprotein-anchoring transpeptidase ErfK/SrfK